MLTNVVTIIAATLFMEAAGESYAGKEAVASVIIQRSQERSQTAEQVCLSPKQFSCWNIGKDSAFKSIKTRISKSGTPDWNAWIECINIAAAIVDGTFSKSVHANHYFADWITPPKWAKNMQFVEKIGKHSFYLDK